MIPESNLFLMWELKHDLNGEFADIPSPLDLHTGLYLWCLQQPCLTSLESVATALSARIKCYDA